MKFKSRRDNFFRVILFGAIFVCFVPVGIVYEREGFTMTFLTALILITLIAGLLIWVWHHTYYTIDSKLLSFNSGPFRGRVKIENIKKLTINKTSHVGLKFGLARNGIIVETNSHTDLYISPTDPKAFIDSILQVNSKIKIIA